LKLIDTRDILDYINGKLSGKKRDKVKLWIDSSRANKEEYLFLKAAMLHDPELKDFEVPDEEAAWDEIEGLLTAEEENKPKVISLRARIIRIVAVAASLVLIFFAIKYFGRSKGPLYVTTSSLDTIVLVDGTKVVLDSFSTLRYYTRIEDDFTERRVELTGGAKFFVAKYRNLPFVVKNGEGITQVLGTVFTSKQINGGTQVENISGLIKLYDSNDPNIFIILHPGEKAFLKDGKIKKIEDKKPAKKVYPKGQYYKIGHVIEYLFDKYETTFNTAPYADIKMNEQVFVYLNQPLDSLLMQLDTTAKLQYRKTCKNCYEIVRLRAK